MKPSTVKAWSSVHTWTSLICTLFLIMLCLTGLGMIWINEIDSAFAGHPPRPPSLGVGKLADLDAVFKDAERRRPGEKVTYADWAFDGVLLGVNMADPAKPKARRQLVYDAASGRFIEDLHRGKTSQPVRTFLTIINRLHIELFAGQAGEYVLAFMGSLFVIATVSGLVLYAPFMRKLEFGTIRTERSSRARWLDIHNLVGVATVGWVLVVSVTGVMNAFTVPAYAAWRKAIVPPLLAPYKGKPPETVRIGPMMATERAQAANPGSRMVRISPPGGRDGSPRHYVVWTEGSTPVTSKLFRPVLVVASTPPPARWCSPRRRPGGSRRCSFPVPCISATTAACRSRSCGACSTGSPS
jgi:uncharacterized iron-regulated membrane protein